MKNYPYDKIGIQIRLRRKALKIAQEVLAEKVGLSRSSIVNIETGRQALTIDNLYLFCIALECELNDILPTIQDFKKSLITDPLIRKFIEKYPDKEDEILTIFIK